jgi:hypothetical protein
MVYMDADNNLESFGIEDLNEMEGVNLEHTGINVIVLIDRISNFDESNGGWTDTRLYKVEYDPSGSKNTTIVSRELASAALELTIGGPEELDMSDPAVCSAFIDFCKTEYPADEYCLIFWDHGNGWMKDAGVNPAEVTGPLRAVCQDATTDPLDNMLYTAEVGDCIEGKGITVVGFDVCYAGMLEVAYELRNDASYMIASEETEGGDGWEYDVWLKDFISTNKSPRNLIISVVHAYALQYSTMSGATLSGIDLSRIGKLNTALNNFCQALYNGITNQGLQKDVRETLFGDVEDFYPPSGTGDLNLDIWHMADVIQKIYNFADFEAAILKNILDDTIWNSAIVSEWHHKGLSGNPNAHGLAIHYCRIMAKIFNNHADEYMAGYEGDYPLEFVENSDWVPDSTNERGLLYRLWYEVFE